MSTLFRTSQVVLVVKNPPADVGDKGCRFNPLVRKIPKRRACQATPVFLSGESHRQRSLEGYNPWGHKESETTEKQQQKTVSTSIHCVMDLEH